jgi:hypothetical protein
MPADSIPAAHSALTEMSAHPVSKSSFRKESTRSHVHPKEASNSPRRGAIRLESAMSVMGRSRSYAHASFVSGLSPKAEKRFTMNMGQAHRRPRSIQYVRATCPAKNRPAEDDGIRPKAVVKTS